MSRVVARVASPAGSTASDGFSSYEELPGKSNMWCPLLEAVALPQHRRVFGDEHVPQQQGCSVAIVPLSALREPGGAVVHR